MRYLHVWILCIFAAVLATGCGGMDKYPSLANADSYRGGEAEASGAFAVNMPAKAKMDANDGMLGGMSDDITAATTAPSADNKPTDATSNETTVPTAKNATRLIIYQADMGLYVFEIDDALKEASAATKKLGGWVQQSTTQSLSLRVPVANFDALVAVLEKLGDTHRKNVVGTDVTEEFFDLQIRLRNAEALRKRYLTLLEQAKTVKDSLLIEKELARITGQIEQFKGRIKFLKDHGMYSTVSIYFDKKPDQPQQQRVTLPFYWIQSYSLENVFY